MSKLFTPRALLIQAMLYAISRAIFTLVKSEMKTSKISGTTTNSRVITSGSSEALLEGKAEAQDLIQAIDGK